MSGAMKRSLTQTLLTAALLLAAASPALSQDAPARTRVLMLGTGIPFPGERSGPATVIMVDSVAYLVDAGSGVMKRWTAELEKGVASGDVWSLRTAFITTNVGRSSDMFPIPYASHDPMHGRPPIIEPVCM